MGNKVVSVTVSFLFLLLIVLNSYAITPNPIISRGKPVFGSPSSNITSLVNGKYGDVWMVSNGSWAAIDVGTGYTKVLVNWNNTGGSWSDSIASATSCRQGMSIPVDYELLASSNSTDGTDGDWKSVLTIQNNTVSARSHSIDIGGANWVKMSVTKGGGFIDELEVFDLSKGGDDIWFFPGTSITAVSYKSTVPSKNFADFVNEKHASYNPAIIRGGIGCINSTTMANDISRYLDMTRNVKYWAIEMGTNDAWGGGTYNLPAYIKNMQKIIDSCKANNIQPIIARMIATDSAKAKWQVHPDFLKAIDSLTEINGLIPGPDLYAYFSKHPEEFSDGVHPNTTGALSLIRLWAEKMDSLYNETTVMKPELVVKSQAQSWLISIKSNAQFYTITANRSGTLTIHSLTGKLLTKTLLGQNESFSLAKTRVYSIIRFSSETGIENIVVANNL
ncbi:MAG: SGNH/GDSL hydrolase family protein [Fibrobacter sp.]|nr:SGNH/GDSL hydrolase family protein [Fibrobacter sp.]